MKIEVVQIKHKRTWQSRIKRPVMLFLASLPLALIFEYTDVHMALCWASAAIFGAICMDHGYQDGKSENLTINVYRPLKEEDHDEESV